MRFAREHRLLLKSKENIGNDLTPLWLMQFQRNLSSGYHRPGQEPTLHGGDGNVCRPPIHRHHQPSREPDHNHAKGGLQKYLSHQGQYQVSLLKHFTSASFFHGVLHVLIACSSTKKRRRKRKRKPKLSFVLACSEANL